MGILKWYRHVQLRHMKHAIIRRDDLIRISSLKRGPEKTLLEIFYKRFFNALES